MRGAQLIGARCRTAYAPLLGLGFVLEDDSVVEPATMQSWEARSASCLVSVLVDWRPPGEVLTLIGPDVRSAVELDRLAGHLGIPPSSWPKTSAPTASLVERRIGEQAAFVLASFRPLLEGDFTSAEELLGG